MSGLHACTARVTVLGLYVSVCVCLFVRFSGTTHNKTTKYQLILRPLKV